MQSMWLVSGTMRSWRALWSRPCDFIGSWSIGELRCATSVHNRCGLMFSLMVGTWPILLTMIAVSSAAGCKTIFFPLDSVFVDFGGLSSISCCALLSISDTECVASDVTLSLSVLSRPEQTNKEVYSEFMRMQTLIHHQMFNFIHKGSLERSRFLWHPFCL